MKGKLANALLMDCDAKIVNKYSEIIAYKQAMWLIVNFKH